MMKWSRTVALMASLLLSSAVGAQTGNPGGPINDHLGIWITVCAAAPIRSVFMTGM